MDQEKFSRTLLNYPLQILGKVIEILVTHPEEVRQRVDAARSEFAHLAHLDLPPHCARRRDLIFKEFEKRDRNKRGIQKKTASKIAAQMLALQSELQSCHDDLAR